MLVPCTLTWCDKDDISPLGPLLLIPHPYVIMRKHQMNPSEGTLYTIPALNSTGVQSHGQTRENGEMVTDEIHPKMQPSVLSWIPKPKKDISGKQ